MARRGDPHGRQYSVGARERLSEKRAVREGRNDRDARAARYVRDALRPRADYGGEPDSFSSAHVEDTLPQTTGSADHGHVVGQRANRVVSKWRLHGAHRVQLITEPVVRPAPRTRPRRRKRLWLEHS